MKAFQFEGQHDTEESDDQESECQHIYNVEGTYGRLPQDDQRTNDGEDAESHVPSPLTGAITLLNHCVLLDNPKTIKRLGLLSQPHNFEKY